MSTNIYITTKKENTAKYMAHPTTDGTGILIERLMPGEDVFQGYCVATFYDCGSFISSTIRLEDKKFSQMCRTPSSKYTPEYGELEDNVVESFEKACVSEAETPYNAKLRVHLACIDPKEKVFTKFIVTCQDGNSEKVVAHARVDRNNDILFTVYGYPAGYEVTT